MTWSSAGYTVLLVAALLWTAGILASPILVHADRPVAGIGARLVYSQVCHQDAARSHRLFGFPLGVCNRCSGIYFAFTATVLVFPLLRRTRTAASFSVRRSAIFILPMFLDYMLDVAGVWSNFPLSRTLSGAVGGIGLALFTVPAWMEAWKQLFVRDEQIQRETRL